MTGYEALRENAAWIDISNRGKLRLTGEDRARLLHAMSTNHVQGLQPGDGLYAFFLSSQGRILADACIYNLGESLLLDTEPEIVGKLLEHLDKYIIADDVTVENETDQWATIAIEGPQGLDFAARFGMPVAEKKYSVNKWDGGFVARVASTGPDGVRIFVPHKEIDSLANRLKTLGVPNASAAEAHTVRLENAVPRYGEEVTERNLVQETQALDAVHWNKGCYLGQEIVERVRSRAQIHRLLVPIGIESTAPLPVGTKLSVNGVDVGEISSADYSPAFGKVVGFAYLRAEAVHGKPAMTVAGSDPPVSAWIRQ